MITQPLKISNLKPMIFWGTEKDRVSHCGPFVLIQISNFQTTVSNRVIHKGVCVWHSSSQKVDGNLSSSWKSLCSYGNVPSALLDTIQDFLNELGIEPHIHLVEIIIFSVYHVIIRPIKSLQRADKIGQIFRK